MTSVGDFTWDVGDESETAAFGAALFPLLRPGDVIGLVGDLGAGKTRFVQALLGAAGIDPAAVRSPTFTLIHEYSVTLARAGNVSVILRHCDAYRLRPGEFADLGLDELFAPDGIAIVEWANLVRDDLPAEWLELQLEHTGPTARRITARPHGSRVLELATGLAHCRAGR